MTRIPAKFIVLLVTILYLTGIVAYAQSLADLAREEQKRRDSISGSRTIIFKFEPPVVPDETVRTVYQIQAASFSRPESAAEVRDSLAGKLGVPVVVHLNPDTGTSQIRIGKFSTREEAQDYLPAVHRDYPDAFIVTGEITSGGGTAAEEKAADDKTKNPQDAYAEKDEEKSGPDEAAVPYGKSETQWRKAASDARSRIKQLEEEAKSLASRRDALQRQHRTNVSQRGSIRDEINKTRQAQEQNGKNLEQARRELQSLQDDARSSGAPPGWIE